MSDEDWDEQYPMQSEQKNANVYEEQARGGGYRANTQRDFNRRENFNGNSERRNYEFKQTMDIRAEHIGRIIGRAGANIKRVQSSYGVKVDLNKNDNIVEISADNESSIESAMQDIKNQLSEDSNAAHSQQRQQSNYKRDNSGAGYAQHRQQHNNFNRQNYAQNSRNSNYEHAGNHVEEHNVPLNEDGVIDWDKLNIQAEAARKERWAKCPALTKNFYNEAPEVANLTLEAVEQIRAENNHITVARMFKEGGEENNAAIPNPVWKFEQCFADYPDLLEEIAKQGFEKPSPIQTQAWPILLKGEDMIGIAQTGTGKTLAFLLPAMIHTEGQSLPRGQRGGPNVLIMAPTRELALQIEKEVNKYQFRGMKAVCVYGGGDRREQISHVESGVEIIICTPGRLNDLIMAKVVNVESVTYLVLDEADRMLDMGFEPQIRKVLLDIRPDRQTIMTSATWPPGVRRLAQSYMSNPIQVCVGSLDLAATETVKQVIEICDEGDKAYLIRNFIKNMGPDEKVIIFMGKKSRADDLSSDLTIEGFMCTAIHGSREQCDREQAIADISSGYIKILIATDLASRGLDIEDITHVINYDFPRNIEEYVHRVGRTGRAGRSGTSISFITRSEWGVARELIDILEKGEQQVPDELRQMAERFTAAKARQAAEGGRGGRGGRGGGRGRGGGGGYRNDRVCF